MTSRRRFIQNKGMQKGRLFHASIFQKQYSIVHLNTCRVKFISNRQWFHENDWVSSFPSSDLWHTLWQCAERSNGKCMNNLRTKTKECLFHASIFQKQCSIVHLNTCRVKFISIGNYTCMCNWFGSKIAHTLSIRPTHRQNVCQWSLDRKLETQSFSWNHCLFEIKNSVL